MTATARYLHAAELYRRVLIDTMNLDLAANPDTSPVGDRAVGERAPDFRGAPAGPAHVLWAV